jgi:hypothetical protein
MRRWLIGAAIAVAVLTAGVVVAIAAGGSDDGGEDPRDAMTAFRDCMAEQGVELPAAPEGPEGGGATPFESGTPPQVPEGEAPPVAPEGGLFIRPGGEEQSEAMEACADLLPAPPDGAQGPGFRLAPQS